MQPLILLHGALGSAQSMFPLSTLLDDIAEVHILDFSGHGESRWPEGGYSMERFEEDVLNLLDERGLPAAHIFGYSMGGFVALRLAKSHPDRVLSVTTLATKFDWTEETCLREAQSLDPDTLESKVPRFVAGLAQAHSRHGWRKVVESTRDLLKTMSEYRFRNGDLSSIPTKVRLMVGDRDKMVRIDETRDAFRNLPNAEFAVLPGTPHALEAVNRELLAANIRTVLKSK
jgi:pimeloyl-ACP methyl ester carboxylesterase